MPCHGSNYTLNILSLLRHASLQVVTSFGGELFFDVCVCVCVFELTSYLALCEMYWPRFCPRDDRGLFVFTVSSFILIFRIEPEEIF